MEKAKESVPISNSCVAWAAINCLDTSTILDNTGRNNGARNIVHL